GSFGSSSLYYVVPKVILFRLEHSRRTLVEKVDFISAPGTSPDNVHRPGGPIALVTARCLFTLDSRRRRFELASVHPGHTIAEVVENTGFEFDRPPHVPVTPAPSPETLRLLRTVVAPQLTAVYPRFAAELVGMPQKDLRISKSWSAWPRCMTDGLEGGCACAAVRYRLAVGAGERPGATSDSPGGTGFRFCGATRSRVRGASRGTGRRRTDPDRLGRAAPAP